MKNYEGVAWVSPDGRFGVEIQPLVLQRALACCERAGRVETGGIIVGRYNSRHDCADVFELQGPPIDSKGGSTWFQRGAGGLAEYLRALWHREGRYYLGEWHFHPGAVATPSGQDITQMRFIARDPDYRCPEPLLVIVGGRPPSSYEVAAFVVLSVGSLIPLDRPREHRRHPTHQ